MSTKLEIIKTIEDKEKSNDILNRFFDILKASRSSFSNSQNSFNMLEISDLFKVPRANN